MLPLEKEIHETYFYKYAVYLLTSIAAKIWRVDVTTFTSYYTKRADKDPIIVYIQYSRVSIDCDIIKHLKKYDQFFMCQYECDQGKSCKNGIPFNYEKFRIYLIEVIQNVLLNCKCTTLRASFKTIYYFYDHCITFMTFPYLATLVDTMYT